MPNASVLATAKARQMSRSGKGRRIREVAGVPQAHAAAEIGIAKSTLCRWEKGERTPTGPAAERWLALLALLADYGTEAA
jgi:DNA-binding transcriptional regulator YiaG